MTYRRVASPLHAARAAAGCAYCAALAGVALIADHPVVLLAVLVAEAGAAAAAGAGRQLRRAALFAAPFALAIAVINPIVTGDGLTVIARGGEVPWLGHLDITLEATAVDPDEVLRLFRRVSFRSALTAALATRMVPVLARDAGRLAEAQRCRPAGAAPRLAVVRATAANALDRAIDVAATLELRGYGSARRAPRVRRPWSRHDLAFSAAAAGLVVLAVAGELTGITRFEAYPRLRAAGGPGPVVVAAAIVACALAPFADRRGIGR